MKCFFDRPIGEAFTSSDTYQYIGIEQISAVTINTLAAVVLGKNKTHAALLGASSILLAETFHFSVHYLSKNDSTRKLFGLLAFASGLMIAITHSHFAKKPYLSWSNLVLTATPFVSFTIREQVQSLFHNS